MAQVRLDYLNEIVNGVEVCALLGDNQDGLECPAKFPVIISLSIYDTTAGRLVHFLCTHVVATISYIPAFHNFHVLFHTCSFFPCSHNLE